MTENLLQLDKKEEPRLSPNDNVNGESRLQEKHKKRARLNIPSPLLLGNNDSPII
jgi:hypothetical protein